MTDQQSVSVSPTPITAGQEVEIRYQGQLVDEGAEKIYLHAGVGLGDNWDDVTDVEMVASEEGEWEAELRLNTTERFNFCFKDNADNWDNNGGENWSFEVHNGQQYS